MRVALVYDYLVQFGGGERLLGLVARIFPGAPIYTLFADRKKFAGAFSGHEIVTSPFDCALVRKRHRAFIPLLPALARTVRVPSEYDTVISLTAGFAKGIRIGPHAKHLCYCFTPLRYAWDPSLLPFSGRLAPSLRFVARPALAYLRRFDRRTGARPHRMLTLSRHIAYQIRERYGREAPVLYPPVDGTKFFFDPGVPKAGHFIAAGRLMRYKRFDLVIEAFNRLGLPLVIVGVGPDEARLKRLVRSPHIRFAGFVSDSGLRRLYAGARAFIFPHIEDFGLTGAEAISCGTPCIAFRAGGAAEIVEEGTSGLFFDIQSEDGLVSAVRRFEACEGHFSPRAVAQSAVRFSHANFERSLRLEVEALEAGSLALRPSNAVYS